MRLQCGPAFARHRSPSTGADESSFWMYDDLESYTQGEEQLVVTAHTTTKRDSDRLSCEESQEAKVKSAVSFEEFFKDSSHLRLRQVGRSCSQSRSTPALCEVCMPANPVVASYLGSPPRDLGERQVGEHRAGRGGPSEKLRSFCRWAPSCARPCLSTNVTGDEYKESQDDNTFLAPFTFTDTTCNDTQPV